MKDEYVGLKGEFTLIVTDKKGNEVERFQEKNLIVNVAKNSLAKLLGGSGSGKSITKIAFGDNGTSPDVSDTVITNSVTKAITGGAITYPEINSVQFAYTLGLSEGNGLAIAEFGLLGSDNSLFARKTRSVINKTADLQFTGTWKIIF